MNPEDLERVGRWPVRGILGQGGFSWVFEVEDERLQQRRALKMLKPEAGEGEGYKRFWREARILASIDDPHLVRIYELDHDEGTGNDYYVMELLSGQDLAKLLREKGALTGDQVAQIFLGVLQGLGRLHEQRPPVIHRDIKPANVQITDDGRPKLLDLGIARMARSGDETVLAGGSEITTFAAFMGTVKYASPEQLRVRELGPPSDVFSIGLCLFEALEGRHPYTDMSDLGTQSYQDVLGYYAQLEATRGSLSLKFKRAPKPLQGVVRRALAIRTEDRFQNAGEMRAALQKALAGQAPAPVARRRPAAGGRGRGVAAAAIALLLGAAGAGYWWWQRPSPEAPVLKSPVEQPSPAPVVRPAPPEPSTDALASQRGAQELEEEVNAAARDEGLSALDAEPFRSAFARADRLWREERFDESARSYDAARSVGVQILTAHRKELEELAKKQEPPPPPPNTAPILAVSPSGPLTLSVGERVTLSATARDPEGGSTRVEYAVRDPGGATSQASGDRYTFAPKAPGSYRIDVVAKDANGAASERVRVTASVRAATPAPPKPAPTPAPPSPKPIAAPAGSLDSVLDDYADAIRSADIRKLQAVWKMDSGSKSLFTKLFSTYGSLSVSVTPLSREVHDDTASLRFTQVLHGVESDGGLKLIVQGPMDAELTRRGDYWQITRLQRAR